GAVGLAVLVVAVVGAVVTFLAGPIEPAVAALHEVALRAAGLPHRGVRAVAVLQRILVVVPAKLELAGGRASVAGQVVAVIAVLGVRIPAHVDRARVDLAVAAHRRRTVVVAVPRVERAVAGLDVVRADGVLLAVAADVESAVGLAVAVIGVVGPV